MRIEPLSFVEKVYSPSVSSAGPPSFPDTLSTGYCQTWRSLIAQFFRWVWHFLYNIICWERDSIVIETQNILEKGEYFSKGIRQLFKNSLKHSISQTKEYNIQVMKRCYPIAFETTIQVTKKDPIETALEKNETVLITHNTKDLYRRSGLSKVHRENQKSLPLRKNSVLFSPIVPILREERKKNYQWMNKPANLSIITTISEKDDQQIYNEFFAAMEHECKNVVIVLKGDIDPKQYLTLLQKYFAGTFEMVTFVILREKNFNKYQEAINQIHGKVIFNTKHSSSRAAAP